MKKGILALFGLILLASCSVKTNEEKARELIEPKIKANLIKPETYEFAQMQLDSCFSDNSERNPEAIAFALKVAKLYKEYLEYKENAEEAESSMAIFASSFGYQDAYEKQQHQKYKSEMERAKRKATTVKENILQLYKDNKQFIKSFESAEHEFTGWVVSFSYRAETAGGMKKMDISYFFLNKDLTEITHSFSVEDVAPLQSVSLDDLGYEFEEELKEIFGEE